MSTREPPVARSGDRPNIVLINCDDLGYGDLGCYGSTRNDTPALDRLAAEGLRCTDVSMASPVCSPSRGALLTGCYPPRIGFGSFEGLPVLFPGQPVGLPPSEVSIGRLLSDAGYATLMVGKWHCGDQPEFLPTNHGFDRYFGLPYSNDMGRQLGTALDAEGHQAGYPPLPLLDGDEVIEQQPDQASLTGRYVTEVLRFMRAHQDRPFFVYLAHLYVHLPIYVPDEFARRSRNGDYGAAVAAIDWATDVLLAELDRLGLAERTLVVFTSDNGALDRPGGGSNLPLRGHKGSTWEGGVRVPFMARWPGVIEPGRVCDELLSSLDLYPTLARLAGTRPPAGGEIDGVDVSGVLFEGGPSPREHLAHYLMDDLCAVRDARWKLHVARDGAEVLELYDLHTDPGEIHDVAQIHPGHVQRLQEFAEDCRERLGDARLGRTGSEVRPIGRVEHASTLTTYDPNHPYYAAEYDLPDRG